MVFFLGGILKGITQAWHYVASAVDRGLTAVGSYVQVSDAGIVVSQKDWEQSYDLLKEAQEGWRKITDIPEFYSIPGQFALDSPFDWRRRHVMKMKIQGVDLNTGESIEQWITVENDKALTKSQWLGLADQAVSDSPFGYDYRIDYVSEYEYYQRE